MIAPGAGRVAAAALLKLAQRIREEFEEAPGLRVTIIEASRFWGLDNETSGQVLEHLLSTGFLRKGLDGRYRTA